MRVCTMRSPASITSNEAGQIRPGHIATARSSPRRHVWRTGIVLPGASGPGTTAIMAGSGTATTRVWRGQERDAGEGGEGLPRDRTRPPVGATVSDDRSGDILR